MKLSETFSWNFLWKLHAISKTLKLHYYTYGTKVPGWIFLIYSLNRIRIFGHLNLGQLYAPMLCITFQSGIFPDYPLSRHFREILCTAFCLWHPLNQKFRKSYLPFFLWDIPYPNNFESSYVPTFFGDYPISKFFKKTM